ncbi:MAG: carboxypeptidase-like regulatory domain-containing protein, partial [Bacteroidota bacterium]
MKKSYLLLLMSILFMGTAMFAQTGTIVGSITDSEGLPLAGATVRVENTTLGTLTDLDGAFSLSSVPEGLQSVVITIIGYQRLESEVSVSSG